MGWRYRKIDIVDNESYEKMHNYRPKEIVVLDTTRFLHKILPYDYGNGKLENSPDIVMCVWFVDDSGEMNLSVRKYTLESYNSLKKTI